MAVPFNAYIKNQKGAKEQGNELAKPFKLEQALYKKVQEHENLEQGNLAPQTNREKKAVDFFLRRRVRCDKFVKESISTKPVPEDDISEEEKARIAEEKLQKELAEKYGKGIKVENIKVAPIKGEIKLPEFQVNSSNNGNTAKPFNSEATSMQNSTWSSVKFGSVNESNTPLMVSSILSNGTNSLFDACERTPLYGEQKRYKPVNFMNFKSKQKVTFKADNYCQNPNGSQNNISDVLNQVKQAQEDEKHKAAEKARLAERNAKSKSKAEQHVREIGLSRVSLPDHHGKWRPSNDNWKPGVNTDGFFTALAKLNDAKEANKNKKIYYGEKSYSGANHKAFKDNSLATALGGL